MLNITELTCRVCLEEKDVMISIYDDLEDLNTNLSNLLETCAVLQMYENDIFPKYICDECTRELLITLKFREKCCKSQEIFNAILESSNVIGTDELSNSNDLIEYCADQIDIEADELEIQDTTLEYAEQPEVLVDEIELVGEDNGTALLNKCINEPSTNSELPNEAMHEYIIEESSLPEKSTNQLHMNAEKPLEAEVNHSSDYRDYAVSIIHNESTNNFFNKSRPEVMHKFTCDICGALFKQANNLQKHFQKSHNPIHCFICNKCGHCFSLETDYQKHVQKCIYNSDVSVENVKSKQQKVCSTKETECSRKCIYCERDFATPFALRMHLRTHTGERPFQCKYCTKSFKTQSQLNVHHKRHTGQADFICNICDKTFYEQSNLIVHMRSHTGERPHVCTVCKKTFARVFLLQFHMRTHTGERPFKCNYCDKSFRQHTDLRSHLTIHTGKKQHTCTICGKSYIKRSHLVQHMRKHQLHTNSVESVDATDTQKEEDAPELNSAVNSIENDLQNPETIISFNELIENEETIMRSRQICMIRK